MVGWGDPPTNQTDEEIARVAKVEITRAERLARNADRAARKRHTSNQDWRNGSVDSDEEAGVGSSSGGITLNSIDVSQLTERWQSDSKHEVDHSKRNSV
jgi:hypothetical protein